MDNKRKAQNKKIEAYIKKDDRFFFFLKQKLNQKGSYTFKNTKVSIFMPKFSKHL